MNMIKLFGKPVKANLIFIFRHLLSLEEIIINLVFHCQVRVNKASAHQKNLDVGANIFIGNLDPEVTFLHPSLYLD